MDVSKFSHILVDDAVGFCKIDDFHDLKDLGKGRKKLRTAFRPSSFLSFFSLVLYYLRPLPDAEFVEALLRLPLELLELLVELLPLLLLDELVPLLRVLLFELFARLLELPLVPLLRLLLLELFTLPLELPLVPLGRLLLFEPFTRPLVAEPVEAPLLVFGRVLTLFPVRPLALPLLVRPLSLLTLGRSLLFPLFGTTALPLVLLPELMLPPLGLGLTVALGAGSLPLGLGSGLSLQLLCVAG